MREVSELLERLAKWQRERARLSWSEKLVLAETLRAAALAMRRYPARSSQRDDEASTDKQDSAS